MKTATPKVLGAGLVALDLVMSHDPSEPIKAWAGGTCGNVLTILAWHGWDSFPIARMNGDAASERVRADLDRWGVHLDLTGCAPVSNTPIVVEEIRHPLRGNATHKFSWSCLRCGGWLPSFKPITQDAVGQVEPFLSGTAVFFFDRLSRGTLQLASRAAESGALVFFEPSGRGDEKLFAEALQLSHVVKYADQRIADLADAVPSRNRLLEIQTLGSAGLRYRSPHRKRGGGWKSLDAAVAERTVDSCGSGDWCTAGLIAMTANSGLQAFESLTLTELNDALAYGQRLAAWNCGYEGARGGMYSTITGNNPIVRTVSKRTIPTRTPLAAVSSNRGVACPKCDVA